MRYFDTFSFLLSQVFLLLKQSYKDSTESYFKKYVKEHEVVTGKDKEFISFFPVNEKYRMTCRFERTMKLPWFRMESSGSDKKEITGFTE
jgi:hypothetical protein